MRGVKMIRPLPKLCVLTVHRCLFLGHEWALALANAEFHAGVAPEALCNRSLSHMARAELCSHEQPALVGIDDRTEDLPSRTGSGIRPEEANPGRNTGRNPGRKEGTHVGPMFTMMTKHAPLSGARCALYVTNACRNIW